MYHVNKIGLGIAATMLSLVCSAAYAEGLRVNLVATVDNGPAMENVKWTVYRSGLDSSAVTEAKNHSTHVNLPAGSYRVVATLTSDDNKVVIRSRNVHVRTSDSSVVIPMD